MYLTYLRRELAGRKKQTIIVASGLALAIALVVIVNALAGGVRDAQNAALASVYGVGTDLTVTGAESEPGQGGGGRQFEFDENAGETGDDGETTLSQSRLMTDMRRGTLDASTVQAIAGTDDVAAAVGALSLTNTTFDGELPQAPTDQGATDDGTTDATTERPAPGEGGGGFGGGSFDVNSFTVLGVSTDVSGVGPLSAVEVTDGRALDASDAGASVAVVDAAYAASEGIAVGDTIDVGGSEIEVVGIVASTSADADAAANVFLPLETAQELSGAGDVVSTVYVQAASADVISSLQSSLETELPDATVSSQSDLASSVSSSLSSAGALISGLGTWLSVILLVVAVALAVLFTISGVSRRTREIGTLKAIGWSDRRVVGQVAGESVVQAAIGGVIGVVIGLIGVVLITVIAPTVSVAAESQTQGPGGMGGGPGGMGGPTQVAAATDITLTAPLSIDIVLIALALALAGGLVAGVFGGWRASRLRPAEALRAVA
ncbi:ABC transporter permease [Microbacterium dauci]|uniref:ABC transporter permease n=1 Tax=Microbacterium dauci TaxID=3048008 RepID=A0ABT6ZB20_9MICO|nr:ABC transporter permease [Microbacterium sp. LX3-4]MDJ1113354.1 ABC transporter permease [Microbacterium sp. LX3-4]